jgi:hypothetical protein
MNRPSQPANEQGFQHELTRLTTRQTPDTVLLEEQ